MSDDNIMNIQLNKVTGRCDEKCMFKFNYITSSTCVAENNGFGSFYLSYDTNSKNPVTFNNNEYNLFSVQIHFPSVNYYNGESSTGELMIIHVSTTSNKFLSICIPISNTSGTPNNLLNSILNNIVSLNINAGYRSDLKLNEEYNLNSFLKYKPFYYYEIKEGGFDTSFICYGLTESIYITTDLADTIISLLGVKSSQDWGYSPSLFYNKKGPVRYDEDEIYIDCQPVNSSGKVEVSVNNSNSNNNNQIAEASEITIIATLEAIGVFVFIIIILYLGTLLYRTYGSKTPSQNNAQIYSIVDYLSSIFKPST
jgi:hypothetical protein